MAGEISRILAEVLARFYLERCGRPKESAPAQLHLIQRFGSSVNLHVHVHAVVSDGVFGLEEGRLRFSPAPEPSAQELAALSRELRLRILKRLLRLGAVPEQAAVEMLARPYGGFSINGEVRVQAEDREALRRLLGYVLRPALSLKRLSYEPEQDRVRYWPKKGRPEDPKVFVWKPMEFLGRFARLIPPARLHLVRYHGALAPRSPLRPQVTRAARAGVSPEELLAGVSEGGLPAALTAGERILRKTASAAAKSWAACLRRVFEVDPLLCPSCQVPMLPVAVLLNDAELVRVLTHLGLVTEFPKTKPARSPPLPFGQEDSQVDSTADAWDGRDDLQAGD